MTTRLSTAASDLAQSLPRRIFAIRRFRPTVSAASCAADRSGPAFDVTVVRARRRLILEGEFDVAAVERFTAAAASLTVGRRGEVTVDLSAVQFIDAAGLGALVSLRNTLAGGGQAMRLRHPSPRITRVFEAGGLAQLLSPVDAVPV